MSVVTTDVDIDCVDRESILSGMECIFGRIDRTPSKVERHPSGVYFQNIPRDPTTNISTLDYKIANEFGYFKVDFLNVSMYEGVRDETHLRALIDKDPLWEFFQFPEITDQLFHLKGYSYLLQKYRPESVEDLAMILAIIRPAKSYLQSATWDRIKQDVWDTSLDRTSYHFKKSHSLAYALAVVVNLNLLIENMSKD